MPIFVASIGIFPWVLNLPIASLSSAIFPVPLKKERPASLEPDGAAAEGLELLGRWSKSWVNSEKNTEKWWKHVEQRWKTFFLNMD